MGIRMKLGGREDTASYTEGYNAGYNMAMDEMRRRTRSQTHDDWEEPESRRTRSHDDWEVENRRGRRSRAEYHAPMENRQIGFVGEPRQEESSSYEAMMTMLHDLKEGQEHIRRGMADSAKKLDPHMEALLETAVGIMNNPPSTWEPYALRHDYLGIAKMEGKELLAALEAHKPVKDIRKELSHTLAALMKLSAM